MATREYNYDDDVVYRDERTAGIKIQGVSYDVAVAFFKNLGGFSGLTGNAFNGNNTIEYGGKDYTLYDCGTMDYWYDGDWVGDHDLYNMFDIIALAKQLEFSDESISNAINKTNKELFDDTTRSLFEAEGFGTIDEAGVPQMSAEDVRSLNISTLPAMQQLVDRINEQYPDLNATVITKMDAGGETYTYTLEYTDPSSKNGDRLTAKLTAEDLNAGAHGKASDADINTWIKNSTPGVYINQYKEQTANTKANADAQELLGNTVLDKLEQNPGLGISAPTDTTVSEATQNKVVAQTPSTRNLKLWERDKDKNITGAVLDNLSGVDAYKKDSLNLDQHKTLAQLEDIINVSNEESVNTVLRGVDNQRKQLLTKIRNDPELYRSLVQQFRADNAAGVIAGQQTANTLDRAKEHGTNYDTAAEELYSGLFSKDGSVADTTRQSLFENKKGILTSDITAKLNAGSQNAKERLQTAQEMITAFDAAGNALDVENQQYMNDAAHNKALADAEASIIIEQILGGAKVDRAKQDAVLNYLTGLYQEGKQHLNAVNNGDADVTTAIKQIVADMGLDYNPSVYASATAPALSPYGVELLYSDPERFAAVTNPKYKSLEDILEGDLNKKTQPVEVNNTQYQAVLDNPKIIEYLEHIPELTKTYMGEAGAEELRKLLGLDYFTEQGMIDKYNAYSDTANQESNRVFNAAQRAYIASIAAGDAKTADQLIRLAETSTGAKRNLNATAALADQYARQFGLSNTGNRLATDYNNQQSANRKFTADNQAAAITDFRTYLGNGNDAYDKSTFNAVKNAYNDVGILNQGTFGGYGNKLMSTTQSINDTNAGLSLGAISNLGSLASTQSQANLDNLANNISNEAVKELFKSQAKASVAQAGATKNKLKIN